MGFEAGEPLLGREGWAVMPGVLDGDLILCLGLISTGRMVLGDNHRFLDRELAAGL